MHSVERATVLEKKDDNLLMLFMLIKHNILY